MSPENPYEKQGNGHGDLGVLAGGIAVVTGGASGIGPVSYTHLTMPTTPYV